LVESVTALNRIVSLASPLPFFSLAPPNTSFQLFCDLYIFNMAEDMPVSGLDELEVHLQQLVQSPDTPLEGKLFDDVELQLTGASP
jgi:hypothetical protein